MLSQNPTRIMSAPFHGRASVACCQVSPGASAVAAVVGGGAVVAGVAWDEGSGEVGDVEGFACGFGPEVARAAVESVDDTANDGREDVGALGGGFTTGARCSLRRTKLTRISAISTGLDVVGHCDGEAAWDALNIPGDDLGLVVPGDGDFVEHKTPIDRIRKVRGSQNLPSRKVRNERIALSFRSDRDTTAISLSVGCYCGPSRLSEVADPARLWR